MMTIILVPRIAMNKAPFCWHFVRDVSMGNPCLAILENGHLLNHLHIMALKDVAWRFGFRSPQHMLAEIFEDG